MAAALDLGQLDRAMPHVVDDQGACSPAARHRLTVERESRLSDIALKWVVDFATEGFPVAGRIDVDARYLNLHPSCEGMMHDELMAGGKIPWEKAVRPVAPEGTLHPSVLERLALPSVRNFTSYGPYRPANLDGHPQAAVFFRTAPNEG